MPGEFSTKELAKKVARHPLRLKNLRYGVQSWPVPATRAGRHCLLFFYFTKTVLKSAPCKLYPPKYIAEIDIATGEVTRFEPATISDFRLSFSPDKPLDAAYKVDYGVEVTIWMKWPEELFLLYDDVIPLYFTRTPPSETESHGKVIRFRELFFTLAEKPLLPFYRSLNEDFFEWLDTGKHAQSGPSS